MKGQYVVSVSQMSVLENQGQAINHAESVTVCVPGSSANLGPGFDTFGLALSLYSRFTFTLVKNENDPMPVVSITERTEPAWAETTKFLDVILESAFGSNPAMQNLRKRLRLVIDSEIPVGKGVGSSSSMVAGVVWAISKLSGKPIDHHRLIEIGTAIEGHPDNITPCVLGGFVVAIYKKSTGKVISQKLSWPRKWCPLLVVPEKPVLTSKARAILPKMVCRADAIFNLQHASLLIAAIAREDDELLKAALHDKIHEDYRASLIPEMLSLKKFLRHEPALGCVLSGAGSSLLVLTHERERDYLKGRLDSWSRQFNAKILDLNVDEKGLQELDG